VQLLADWTEKYGQVFVWHLGLDPVLVVSDPDEIARFSSNSDKHANLPKWSKAYAGIEPVSLFNWKALSTDPRHLCTDALEICETAH